MKHDTRFVDQKLVYLAAPYTSPDPVRNTHATIKVADELIEQGVTPFVPHLTLAWHLVSPRDDVEFWYALDLAMLAKCDAVLRIGGDSTGADREVDFAHTRNIPVFLTAEELVHWARG